MFDENLLYDIVNKLSKELGCDVVGLHLINLMKLHLEGNLGDDSKLVKEALQELLRQNEDVTRGPYR